jgi:hypothetical protein
VTGVGDEADAGRDWETDATVDDDPGTGKCGGSSAGEGRGVPSRESELAALGGKTCAYVGIGAPVFLCSEL